MCEIVLEATNWIPYSKGGIRRKWYGNNDYIVDWSQKDHFNRSKTTLQRLYLKDGLTWSFMGDFSMRYMPNGFLWDVAGSPCFFDDSTKKYYTLGLLCTKVAKYILQVVNPTLATQALDIQNIPLIETNKDEESAINNIVKQNIDISISDWDSFETSWDFKTHPLITFRGATVRDSFLNWKEFAEKQFNQLKSNEEELNRIFIDIYGLQDELTPEVDDKDITIRRADEKREIKSLISYAVGCMFGRYSLDAPGLIYAGGDFNENKYQKFPVDKDNIIPIADSEEVYYNDDIVGRFKEFIKTAYGEKTLNENLSYIADVLGRKNTESPEDTIRRYFINDFFYDHVKNYTVKLDKKPIYWLFDSGKKNGFKALIYLHRYNPQLVAKIRTEYFHKTQNNYTNRLNNLASESNAIKKNALEKDLREKIAECKEYDEKLAHIANQQIKLDLDDGVKVNYAKLQDVLARIK